MKRIDAQGRKMLRLVQRFRFHVEVLIDLTLVTRFSLFSIHHIHLRLTLLYCSTSLPVF